VLLGWFLLPLPGVEETFRYSGEVAYLGRPAVFLNLIDSPALLRGVWLDRHSCLPLGVIREREISQDEEPDGRATSPGFVTEEDQFDQRRGVSGFMVPFRTRYLYRGRLVSDWRIERVSINGHIDGKLFLPPRR
jgi:hypothetical protein